MYKKQLSVWQGVCYESIIKGLKCYRESIRVFDTNIDSLNSVVEAIRKDTPSLYYVDSFKMQIHSSRRYADIIPLYFFSKEEVNNLNSQLQCVLENVKVGVTGKDEWGSVLRIHDYLCSQVSYHESGQESHSVVGALLREKAVCEGMAKAFKYICDYLDIKCCLVSGYAKSPANPSMMENHAWNKVKINGEWYNIDVTFDNTIGTKNRIRHDYFLISDKDMQKDHIELSKSNLPCVSENLSYYAKKNLIMHNQQQLIDFTKKNIAEGVNSFDFKLPNASDINTIHQKVLKNIEKALTATNKSGRVDVIYNKEQLVFSVNIS